MPEEDFDPRDYLPGLLAGLDQLEMMAPHLGKAAWVIYSALLEAGFAPAQALYLTGVQIVQDAGDAPE